MTTDLWSVDQMKAAFMGVTAHWIEMDTSTSQWKLCSEVIAFQGIFGAHSGLNLGHSFVSLCECSGIITNNSTKVCHFFFCIHNHTNLLSALLHYS